MTVRLIGSAAIAILIGAVLLLGYHAYLARYQPVAAENQHRDPVLIPGINEPEELRVEPVAPSQTKLTAPQQMLADAMNNSGQNSDPTALLPAVNKIIAKYPDYSDAYLMRLGALCNGNDRAAIMSDINNALRFKGNSLVGKDTKSFNSLLSMRGKIEHENGDDRAAMDDLDKAIHADLANASKFANSGGIAPEKTASVCTWTQPDMDAFVQHFPTDYRSYLFRGLYFDFFTRFSHDEALPRAALDDFHKASQVNGRSALPHYFAAKVLLEWSFLKRAGMSDEQRKAYYREPLEELDKALALDPGLVLALRGACKYLFRHQAS